MQEGALLALAAKGILIAALPLLYVWRSHAPDKFRKLAWVTAFLTFDLIVFGGFTRLTDSGLGCPDWPGCYGHSNPLSAGEPIRAAETAQPTGPVTMGKAWVEMVPLRTVPNAVTGAMWRGALESQGIEAIVRSHALPAHGEVLHDWKTAAWGVLLVPSDVLEEARLVLDDFLATAREQGPALDEDTET